MAEWEGHPGLSRHHWRQWKKKKEGEKEKEETKNLRRGKRSLE